MAVYTRSEVDRMIRERLATDPGFRAALLADPRVAVGEAVGVEIPDSVSISVHEESLTDVHLVIPAAAGDEIAEDDLELVSGGGCWEDQCGTDGC